MFTMMSFTLAYLLLYSLGLFAVIYRSGLLLQGELARRLVRSCPRSFLPSRWRASPVTPLPNLSSELAQICLELIL